MRILLRVLSAVIFVLTLLQGAFLLHFITLNPVITEEKPPARIEVRNDTQQTFVTSIFSKLSFIPLFNKERSLVTVIIENHEDARPYQEGLDKALIIQEWFVEGFISRFVAVYDTRDLPKQVGPVRSIRPHFLQGLLPWSTPIFHAGGSPKALEMIVESTKLMSINGLRGTYHDSYNRDDAIAQPHNLFIFKKVLREVAQEMNLSPITWPPYKEGKMTEGEQATDININFFNANHNVYYTYKPSTQRYVRTNGTVEKQAQPRNVLILEMPIESIGEYGRLTIPVKGRGKVLLFRSGHMYPGIWEKSGEMYPFSFMNANGEQLVFARGQTWMTVVPSMERVSWENN